MKNKRYKQYQFKRIDCFTSEIVCDKCEHGLNGLCVPNMGQSPCDVYIYIENKDGKE
jgi:hypothetical protein